MVFGVSEIDLTKAAAYIGSDLGLSFEARESSYHGGLYYLAKVAEGSLLIQRNTDFVDEVEPLEPDWPRSGTILQLERIGDGDWSPWVKKMDGMERSGFLTRLPPRGS